MRIALVILLFASTALAQVGFQPRISISAADGPNVWYDTTTTLDGFIGIGASFMEWDSVTVSASGTATDLRVRARGGLSDQTIKVAIYNNSGTLLTNGVTGIIAASSAEAWYSFSVTPYILPAGTYKLAICASGSVDVKVQTTGGAGTGSYQTQTYASFPPASLPSALSSFDSIFVVGVYSD